MTLEISGRSNRNVPDRIRDVPVECEICGQFVWRRSDHPGVYICAACHRDIVSPHLHD